MKKELLHSITKKDLKIQTFRSGGPGGQNQNKRDSGVRIIHPASGAVGEARDQKSQLQNKRNALKRMIEHPKFKLWNTRVCHEIISGESLDEKVDKLMDDKNIKAEKKENGRWVDM